VPDGLTGDLPRYFRIPLILTGGANFPAMFGVRSWSGYSATMPKVVFQRKPQPANVVGLFEKRDMETLSRVPGAVFLEVTQDDPVQIRLIRKGQEPELIYEESGDSGK
jgi:hypothetical protein